MAPRKSTAEQIRQQLAKAAEGHSFRALAEASGLPHSSIQHYLAGRRPMQLERVEQLAAALGMRLQVKLVPAKSRAKAAASA